MIKNPFFNRIAVIFFVALFSFFGCEEEHEGINSPNTSLQLGKVGSIEFSFDKTNNTNSQADDVDTVTALLTRSGYESIQKNLAVDSGSASGVVYNVAEGKWQLTVEAKDSLGNVIYRGRTDVEVLNNQTTYVSIELAPASTSGDLALNVTWGAGDGINWTKSASNPVLDLGSAGSWDDQLVNNPCVIYDGTTYKMWYAGYKTNYQIGYATSSDGINWTKYSGNPVLTLGSPGSWEDTYVYHPTVIFNGTSYEMWYTGYNGTNEQIGYATSSDGITWTKHSGNPIIGAGTSWESNGVGNPTVLYNGTNYEMWYAGYNSTNSKIGYATSSDGVNWTKYVSNPVLDLGTTGTWDDLHVTAAEVLYVGSNYKMWYSGYDGTNYRIGYATSSDGKTWTKYVSNPVLDLGTTGTWDVDGVLSPSILFDGITYKMWYTGRNGSAHKNGYATSP